MRLLDAACILGSWVARFEAVAPSVGAWAVECDDPEAAICLSSHARRIAGHAAALGALLPSIAGFPPDSFVSMAEDDRGHVSAIEAAGSLDERLGVLYGQVVPVWVADSRRFLADSSPISDMAFIRVAAAILADQEQDLRVGEGLAARRRIRFSGA
jgi:hypothetical protein